MDKLDVGLCMLCPQTVPECMQSCLGCAVHRQSGRRDEAQATAGDDEAGLVVLL